MKRSIISSIVVAALGGIFVVRPMAAAPAQASRVDSEKRGPAGGWAVTVTFPSGQANVLVLLTAGGGALRTSQNDFLSASLASPSYGSWTYLEKGRAIGIAFHNFRYRPDGLIGTSKIRVRATLNEAMDEFTGPFTTQLLDLNGEVVATINGTVDGRRIQVELPDERIGPGTKP